MKRVAPFFALLSLGCAAPFGVRVTFDDADDALVATHVEVALVASCGADPSAEPESPIARASATRGGAMALPSVPAGHYGLVGRAWGDDCGIVAAGCVDVDLSGSPRTLTVALHHEDSARCVAPTLCTAVAGACVTTDAGSDGGVDGGPPRDTGLPDANDVDADVPDTGTIDAGPTDAGPTDAGIDARTDAGPACPPVSSRLLVEVTADITSDTTWDCAHLYSLHREISVTNASTSTITTLTIEPGTVVVAGPDGTGHVGALLVARSARLVAEGTPALPITFTSERAVGMRHAGDWGGIALAGRASATAAGSISALPSATYPAGRYGPFTGTAAEDDWSCGRLAYVRISFGGGAVSGGSGLAGLTMGACGTGTSIHHVQVHRFLDDGITVYGGTVDLSHVLVSASEEDSLDWNAGWRGRVQFFLAWQWPVSAGADSTSTHGIEADTGLDTAGVPRMPRSHPTFFNATFACATDTTDPCVLLQRATEGFFGNTILSQADPTDDALMICDDLTAANATSGTLELSSTVLSDRFGVGAVTSCTTAFDDRAWACARGTCDAALAITFDYAAPVFDPGATMRARCSAVPTDPPDGRPAFFDATATYCGAMSTTDWTAGWTELPVN